MEQKTVLITGIGGNVGQGIIRNIKASDYPIRIVGTNISEFSAGNHLADAFYRVPFGFDPNFIKTIKDIVEKERVDLIIPATDFETYYLSLNANNIPCKIAASGADATEKYLDKYLSWQLHQKHSIPFASSILPSKYNADFDLAIAKPRKGRGSKGLVRNIKNTTEIKMMDDEEYMIQRMHEGREITTAVYVTYNDRRIHGLISLERSLENGATTYCRVVRDFDDKLIKIAEKMISVTNLAGSFNIQSIVEESGNVFPFEVNCRISGTNSIRSSFGFKDVLYTLQELLYNEIPSPVEIIEGFAYRYLSDVIYLGKENELKGNNQDKFIIF